MSTKKLIIKTVHINGSDILAFTSNLTIEIYKNSNKLYAFTGYNIEFP